MLFCVARYLEVVVVPCGVKGGLQVRMQPYAAGSFVAYSVGFPVVLATILIMNRKLIMEDQVCLLVVFKLSLYPQTGSRTPTGTTNLRMGCEMVTSPGDALVLIDSPESPPSPKRRHLGTRRPMPLS
jgi:hypothetical protein